MHNEVFLLIEKIKNHKKIHIYNEGPFESNKKITTNFRSRKRLLLKVKHKNHNKLQMRNEILMGIIRKNYSRPFNMVGQIKCLFTSPLVLHIICLILFHYLTSRSHKILHVSRAQLHSSHMAKDLTSFIPPITFLCI